MKAAKLLRIGFLALLCTVGVRSANAQGAIYNDTAVGTGGIAGASVRVCTGTATGSVGSCQPLANLYTDDTLTTLCNTANGCSNPLSADAKGNFAFHAQPGEYVIDISAANFQPFRETVTVPTNASGPVPFQSWIQLGTVTYSNLPVNTPDGTLIAVSQASATSPCSSGTQTLVARHENGQWNCSSAASVGASVTGVTATAPLASSQGATPNISMQPHGAGQAALGPCAYTATAANPTIRSICAQDVPQTVFQGADNMILSGPADANGNPNFLAVGGGLTFLVNPSGLPTPQALVDIQNGRVQTIAQSANFSTSVPSAPTGEFFVFQNLDVSADGTVIAGDIQATSLAPVWSYPPAPTCNANASATWTNGTTALGPQYWFNMAASTMFRCTNSANGFSISSAMPLGVCENNGTSVTKCVPEPYGLTPGKRYFLFGDGSSGVLAQSGGTTTQDGSFSYSSCYLAGGAQLKSSNPASNLDTPGLILYCQTPMLVTGSSTIGGVGIGRVGPGGTTGACVAGNSGGLGGAGGGSGGAATTNTVGCAGGNHTNFWSTSQTAGGGTAGTFGGAAAGAGAGSNFGWLGSGVMPFARDVSASFLGGFGAAGASGSGNGTVSSGAGGSGGEFALIKAPSLLLDTGSKIQCDAAAGGNSGNASGGGGGGGGGICLVFAGFSVNGSTGITAAGGALGTSGTGQAAAAGGAGIAIFVRAF